MKDRELALFDAISATAKVCGAVLTGDAVLLMVSDLIQYTDEQIYRGLQRCRMEIVPERGFVTFSLAILLDKMGVVTGYRLEKAEAVLAWSQIAAEFYTCGDCDYQHVSESKLRDISPKAAATLRVIGGCRRITHTLIRDIHFVERDFLEAFDRHDDIEHLNALPPGNSPVGTLVAPLLQPPALASSNPVITEREKSEARAVLAEWTEKRKAPRVESRAITEEVKNEARARLAQFEASRANKKKQ